MQEVVRGESKCYSAMGPSLSSETFLCFVDHEKFVRPGNQEFEVWVEEGECCV